MVRQYQLTRFVDGKHGQDGRDCYHYTTTSGNTIEYVTTLPQGPTCNTFPCLPAPGVTSSPSSTTNPTVAMKLTQLKQLKPSRRPLFLLLLLLPALYLAFHHHQHTFPSRLALFPPTCTHSVVYNKPHKTAGTKIQADIVEWASRNHWQAVTCSPFHPNLQLQECVPTNRQGCVIVANHMVLNPSLERMFERKLGKDVLWMTSTRSGRERRLSHFLQVNRIRHDAAALDDLKSYLKRANPWHDYNYMNGELRNSPCPVSWTDSQSITEMASKYDIVIDADLPDVSNVILKHFGLFQLTDSSVNVRGASNLVLDDETEELVKKASCVDEEMHKLLRVRMGSLYEMITGIPCNNRSKDATPCF